MTEKDALLQALVSKLRSRRLKLKFSQEELSHRSEVNRESLPAHNTPFETLSLRLQGIYCFEGDSDSR